MSWDTEVDERLATLAAQGRTRSIRTLDGGGPLFELEGRQVVGYASNDYLGLSQHPGVIQAAQEAAARWGTGAGASRLVVGARPVHAELESQLADWKQTDGALLFPTGYAANLSVLQAFGKGARIVSDELNHASIVDGCRLARAEVVTYKHGDASQAEALVRAVPGQAIVVSDTVFSMEGDVAPLAELSTVCASTGALLVLDDAHVVMPVPDLDPAARVLRVGTLSKALGSLGGYVAGPASYVHLLVNVARPFIFTTAPSPPAAAAALEALRIVRSAEGAGLVERLTGFVRKLRPEAVTPIVSIVLGSETAALAKAQALLDRGWLVPAIRPPTVPVGTSRLRIAFSAAHTEDLVAGLCTALEELGCA